MKLKPKILLFIGNYLPGYKAGGIIRNIANTTDHLCEYFDYYIVTKDRDLGDTVPYKDVKINSWEKVNNALVKYLTPEQTSYKNLVNLINETEHDIIILNGYFDVFTIKILIYRKFNPVFFKPVVVASFGEFAWASLSQKYIKKYIFMKIAKLFNLYKGVTWRASSEFEKSDIVNVLNVNPDSVHITGDLPLKNISDFETSFNEFYNPTESVLKIIFLSRISREKNLDYALKVLEKVKCRVIFDIYGPAENEKYWAECQLLISKMNDNIKITYFGNVKAEDVLKTFSQYDLFLFPTGGEAYGNVIAECLTVGTPVLISSETPWHNLENDGLGWDINLNDIEKFTYVIEQFASISPDQRIQNRSKIKKNIQKRLFDPFVLQSNIDLVMNQLT